MALKKDLRDQKFGKLLVIDIHSRSRNGHVRWNCLCDCGSCHQVLSTHLLSGKVAHCGCDKQSGRKTHQWGGCGDISGNVWCSIRRGASGSKGRIKIDFTISIEYAWEVFLSQDRKCALSGEVLLFEHEDGIKVRNFKTASLDRIDSGLGYVEGNVQWVHKDINLMKGRLNQDLFHEWCHKVSERYKRTNACEINF